MNKLVNSPWNLGSTRICDNLARICDIVVPVRQTVAVEATVRSLSPFTSVDAAKRA